MKALKYILPSSHLYDSARQPPCQAHRHPKEGTFHLQDTIVIAAGILFLVCFPGVQLRPSLEGFRASVFTCCGLLEERQVFLTYEQSLQPPNKKMLKCVLSARYAV